MWSGSGPHHAAGGSTYSSSPGKQADENHLHSQSVYISGLFDWTSQATAPLFAARFSPLWLGKLESAFWYHLWWQLGHARGSKWRDTLNGLLHNTDPDTKILQQFEMPNTQTKKRGYKRGDWEMRQSWLIPPPSLPFSINWTHSYLMHF